MAPETTASLSFDEIIQRDREERDRKGYQELANDIFGKGKKDKSQQNGARKMPSGYSLASRVGISKPLQRSSSNTPKPLKASTAPRVDLGAQKEEQSPRITRNARQNPMAEKAKQNLLSEALIAKGATNHPRPRAAGPEISIRGAAGPYVVVAQNFAAGTTAADIEAAMVPNAQDVINCKLLASQPTVMAELVFHEKRAAESVIETFNNQKADGRVLHVYMKVGGPTPTTGPPSGPKQGLNQTNATESATNAQTSQSTLSAQSLDRTHRRADPQLQDGRYGFAEKGNEMDIDQENSDQQPQQALAEQTKQRGDRRDRYPEDRHRRGDNRYNRPTRDYGQNGYYDRGWGSSRPGDGRGAYSDGRYGYPRRGYR